MNEQCWFIRGVRIGSRFFGFLEFHSEGSPAHVTFDWSKAVGGKTLGFYHSHPSGVTGPSARDDRTMKAWVIAEGRPMICGIFCDGSLRTFLYAQANGAKGTPASIFCYEIDAIIKGRLFWGDVNSAKSYRKVYLKILSN